MFSVVLSCGTTFWNLVCEANV